MLQQQLQHTSQVAVNDGCACSAACCTACLASRDLRLSSRLMLRLTWQDAPSLAGLKYWLQAVHLQSVVEYVVHLSMVVPHCMCTDTAPEGIRRRGGGSRACRCQCNPLVGQACAACGGKPVQDNGCMLPPAS